MSSSRPAGFAVAGAVLAAAVGGGCTVGGGAGAAVGPIEVLGCNSDLPEGNLITTPEKPFSLNPTFFAGEPIEDVSENAHQNRLVIRMQRSGEAIEFNDTLTFDIQNSLEVARCVRGRTVNGVGDFEMPSPGSGREPWCDLSGGTFVPLDGGMVTGDGGATPTPGVSRLRMTNQGYVQASLVLLQTCPLSDGAALVGHAIDGWIEFLDFGGAPQPNLDPEQRTEIKPSADFKVDYDQRLRAKFHLVLEDDRVITARRLGFPIPNPRFGGTLDGFFDFELVRGRAAQPFP